MRRAFSQVKETDPEDKFWFKPGLTIYKFEERPITRDITIIGSDPLIKKDD